MKSALARRRHGFEHELEIREHRLIVDEPETAPRDGSPRNHDGDCPDKDGRGGSGSDTSVEL